ncbi:MAG TPA: PadR family transcriptional regulator [Thermoanaerobaculia bacterium]|nr:PadR family transcriptional regulator [Thermoanaerobaculia bacterium]
MSLNHILLALVADRPSSGYALKRRIDTELAPLWTAELSQIYPALGRLQRAGFLSGRVIGPSAGPASYRYRVTVAGRRELARWIAEPPRIPSFRDETLSRLAIGRALGKGAPEALAAYERMLADEAARLRRRMDAGALGRIARDAALARLDGLRRWARAAEPKPESVSAQRLLPLARRRRGPQLRKTK